MLSNSNSPLIVKSGSEFELPLFMPVYQTNAALVSLETMRSACQIEALMVNAFFLYKNRELRDQFKDGLKLREHVGFPGLLMTDSGAFQGFARKLYLNNVEIIKFQDDIATDISSPLDLVTPPSDSRNIAEKKMLSTLKRIEMGMLHSQNSILAGVQQGGRFLDLRRINMERLMEFGCSYIAIGSLVPFFTSNHDMSFVGTVIKEAREIAGTSAKIHVYGAGDPVDIPLMSFWGADIFDSSSYAHYAKQGAYMTPYGAIKDTSQIERLEPQCACCFCFKHTPAAVVLNESLLAAHNLWTICNTIKMIRELRKTNKLYDWIESMLPIHQSYFPDSRLMDSWRKTNG